MAKKKPNFRQLYSSWSERENQLDLRRDEEKKNRANQVESALSEIEKEFGTLSDSQYAEMANQFIQTGSLDTSTLPSFQPADFSDVTSRVLPSPKRGLGDYLTAAKDVITEGFQAQRANIRASGEQAFAEDAYTPGEEDSVWGDMVQIAVGSLRDLSLDPRKNTAVGVAGARDLLTRGFQGIYGRDNLRGGAVEEADSLADARRQAALRGAESARAEGMAAAQRQDAASDVIDNEVVDRGLRAVAGVAGTPEQLGSVAGGLVGSLVGPQGTAVGAGVGALPISKIVFDTSYAEARNNFNATREEAQAYATVMAGLEFGIEGLTGGAGKVMSAAGKKLGLTTFTKEAAQQALERKIAGRVGRTLGTAAVEGGSEALTELGGDAVREVMEQNDMIGDTEALKRYNAEQATTRLDRVLDAGLAGAIGGGTIGGTAGSIEFAFEQGAQQSRTTKAAIEGFKGERSSAETRAAEQDAEVTRQLFEVEQDLQRQAPDRSGIEAAFTQAEETAARQKELEMEAGFQTIERDANLPRSRVERYGTSNLPEEVLGTNQVVERVPVNPPAEVTPEQVQAQREAEAQAEAERVERVEFGKDAEILRKEGTKLQEAQKKADKKAAAAQAKRRREVAAQVMKENPGKSPDELVPLLRERLAKPAVTQEQKDTLVAAGVPKETVEKMSPASVEKRLARVPAKPTKSDSKLTDADVGDLASKLGVSLGMRERLTLDGKKEPAPIPNLPKVTEVADVDVPAFEKKAGDIVKSLVKRNKQDSVDVQNLIQQGKLIMAPSEASIGRADNGNVAEYDPETGKMYLYTDKVEAKDTVGILARALHEATHGGQFNDRQGRPDIFRQMMNTDSASKRIVAAARKGNAMAQKALDRAVAASPDVSIQDLELVPYFVTEAVKARSGTLGQMRGVATDIISGANKFLKDKLGVDLDIGLADLETAAQQTAGELVQTDVAPARGETMGMIYPTTARGYDRALQEGRVYTSSEGNRQFVLSDADAKLKDGAAEKLAAGTVMRMEEVMDHPVLFHNMPAARDILVAKSDNLTSKQGMAQYTPGTDLIEVSKQTAEGKSSASLRSALLHETQHWVQDMSAAREGFVKDDLRTPEERQVIRQFRDVQEENDTAAASVLASAQQLVDGLTVTEKRAAMQIVSDPNLPRHKRAAELIDMIGNNADNNPVVQQFQDSLDAYREAAKKYNAAERMRRQRYLRNPTEAEAFFTQANVNTPQDQLPVNPELDPDYGTEAMAMAGNDNRRVPTLGMAAEAATAPATRRVPAWFTGLFRSDQGAGRVANEIVEYARSSPAGQRMIAEANLGKFDRALKKLADERGTTPEALNAQLTKELDALDKKTDGYEANKAAFEAVAKKYGKAGQALIDLRNQVDDLTLDIVRQRAADGNPLTEAEKKTYTTLLNNLGRYTHRQYAVNAGDVGDQYANKVWDDYQKYKKGKGRNKPVVEENYRTVTKAVQYLVDNNLMIPDDEKLAAMGEDKVRNLYAQWGKVGNPDGLGLDQLKAELATARDAINGDKTRLTRAAEEITQELLNLAPATSAITNFYRGGKLDKGILKQREDVPAELRKLMGEITDPSMRLLLTVGKQAEFVARNKMLLELRDQVGTDIQPPGSVGLADNMQRLDGDTWGPLEGYYVSPNMRALIGDTIQQLATFEQAVAMSAQNPSALNNKLIVAAVDKWGQVAGASKALQIIGNPINFLYNFIGAPRMLLSNGNINPKNTLKAWSTSADLIAYALNPAAAPAEAVRANQFGITDSAFIGEIKSAQYRQVAKTIKEMAGKNPTEIAAKLYNIGTGTKELYAMMDVWSKLANFYHQVDVLTDFYKKEGVTKTPEQIDREAADIVSRTNITYKRAAPIIKAAERGGITQFGTYFYEVFRSEIANVMQGVEEAKRAKAAKTPEGRNAMALQSAKRLSGQALTWMLTYQLAKLTSAAVFGDDEDENKALRALLPEFMRDQDFIKIGKDAAGDDVLFNLARLDPIGPLTDIMRSAMHEDSDPAELGKKMFDLYVAPRVGSQLITALGTMFSDNVRPSRQPLVQQLAPDLYSDVLKVADQIPGVDDKTSKAWTNVVETFLPGIASSYRDTNVRPLREDAESTAYNLMTYMGGTMYKLNPQTAVQYASMDYSNVLKNARKDVSEMFNDHPDLTESEALSRILELRATEKEAYDKIRTVYEGTQELGVPKREAMAMLKSNRVAGEAIRDIVSGNFQSRVIEKSSIDQYRKNEMAKATTRAERREIKEKWDNIWDVLKQVQKDVDNED